MNATIFGRIFLFGISLVLAKLCELFYFDCHMGNMGSTLTNEKKRECTVSHQIHVRSFSFVRLVCMCVFLSFSNECNSFAYNNNNNKNTTCTFTTCLYYFTLSCFFVVVVFSFCKVPFFVVVFCCFITSNSILHL